MDALCGEFIDGGDSPDFNEVTPDDSGATVEETADYLGLQEKLSNFLKALPADERRVAEMLVDGRPVSEVMALTGTSKRKIQDIRKRIAAALAEYRPGPGRRGN